MAEEYCYFDGSAHSPPVPVAWLQLTLPISFGNPVCRERLSTAARIAISIASFVVVFGILLAFNMHRRRRIARANMAFVNAPHDQQQVYPNQYPPPPQGGFFGMPFGGNGQKEQQSYDPQQQYNGQQNPQYNGQYNPQYNAPQYPPAAYDQGTLNQPVSTIPILGFSTFSSLSCRHLRTPVTRPRLALPLTMEARIMRREMAHYNILYRNPPCSSTGTLLCLIGRPR